MIVLAINTPMEETTVKGLIKVIPKHFRMLDSDWTEGIRRISHYCDPRNERKIKQTQNSHRLSKDSERDVHLTSSQPTCSRISLFHLHVLSMIKLDEKAIVEGVFKLN